MTISNSFNFSVDRDELINLAHQHIGAVGEGETCTTAQITEGAKLLNMVVKARAGDGMPLWSIKTAYILPFTGSNSINATGSHVVSDFDYTTTSAAALSGATTLTLTSVADFGAGYNVGIEQSDGTVLWTTQSGAAVGNDITLATALTEDVSSGAMVYVYPTASRIPAAPLRILNAYMRNTVAQTDYPINQISQDEYFSLGNKATPGTPNQIYYDPDLVGTASFYLYPRFTGGQQLVYFNYVRPFADFDSASDTPDFPQAFYRAIMVELASMLGPKFGVSMAERKALQQEATAYFEQALQSTFQEVSTFMEPEGRNW